MLPVCRRVLPLLCLLALLSACASSGGGAGPSAAPAASEGRNTGDNPDRFVFKVSLDAMSSLVGSETVDQRAKKIIERHRMNNAYNSYEIVRRSPIGGSQTDVEYEVQFAR